MSESFDYWKWADNQPGRAYQTVRRVEQLWGKIYAAREEGYELMVLVATPFGVHRISSLMANGRDLIFMGIVSGRKIGDLIFAPLEHCGFMFQYFQPTPDKPKVILGFAPSPKDDHDA